MRFRPHSRALIGAIAVAMTMALVGCGAGSRTGAQTATEVQCDFENPAEPTTINVLAYNSSAVDPFTNTMVKSCTKENVTVKHDPIDFAGQVQPSNNLRGPATRPADRAEREDADEGAGDRHGNADHRLHSGLAHDASFLERVLRQVVGQPGEHHRPAGRQFARYPGQRLADGPEGVRLDARYGV